MLRSLTARPASWKAAVALAALSGVLAAGCGPKPSAAPTQPPPTTVTVASIQPQPVVEWNEYTGRTEAIEHVEVRPRISGYLHEIRFKSGQRVKKGDVLFVIDPRWQQADFDRREAEYEQARVRVQNAEREAGRTSQLLADRAISTEEAEARIARYNEAKAALLAAEAGRDSARLDLDYTQVRAPIDGRVSRERVTIGNYVSGLAGAATLLTTIVSEGPIFVYADVDEQSLLRFNHLVRDGKMMTDAEGRVVVEMQLADEDGFPHRGVIESFDNRLDAESGSILVRAIFSNEEGRILPGLFARIRIPASAEYPALLVTERAIGTDQSQKYVLTVTSTNTVAYRPVKLGPMIAGKRIVREGLAAGDRIIVNGLQRARPGSPVTPEPEVPEAATAASGPGSGAERSLRTAQR